jgi:hypothetical protein
MILAVWTFLKSPVGRYVLIGLAALAVVFGIYQAGRSSGVKHERIASAKAIAIVRADLATCKANGQTLEASIASQNARVDALKADSDQRAKMLADALVGARKAALTASQRADKLMALKPKGADVCSRVADVDRVVLEGLR